MPRLYLRDVSEQEAKKLRKIATSQKEEVRVAKRAQLLVYMLDNPSESAGAAALKSGFKNIKSGILWVHRFNDGGIEDLNDKQRSGRPPIHSEELKSAVISLALQKPEDLGLNFALWTLERLQREVKKREGHHLSDSTIWEWMKNEGLEWKRQQSWFHEADQHDPDFEKKE